jgi:TPP-dependent 2-oxoacid decarboxylase
MDISSITSIPTDSLYKFMAISGLLILALSIILPSYFSKAFQFQLFELRKKHDLTQLEIQNGKGNLRNKAPNIGGIYNDFYSANAHLSQRDFFIALGEWLKDNSDKFSTDEVKMLDNHISDMENFTFSVDKLLVENECELKKVEYLSKYLFAIYLTQRTSFVAGLILCVTGFYFWYTKIQVLLDASITA